MSQKTTKELLEEALSVSRAARGVSEPQEPQEPKSDVLKSFFSKVFYKSAEEVAAEEGQTMSSTISTPEFEPQPLNDVELPENAGSKSFDEIYHEAGISSTYCVDSLHTLINSPDLVNQPVATKQLVVTATLRALNQTIDTPIQNAIDRDKALDNYAQALYNRAKSATSANKATEEAIEAEIKAFFEVKEAEIEKLRVDTATKNQEYQNFLIRKQEEEEKMSKTLSPFLVGKTNPVTVGNIPESNSDITPNTTLQMTPEIINK
jgi:hypothetical protein